MDRELILKHLAKVEYRIAQGELNIARQRQRVALQKSDRRGSTGAQTLLRGLEESQSALIATRDNIRATLGVT